MPALRTDLRNALERTVVDARDVAEAGARAALEALAVHHREPYKHMSPEDRRLRNHLRARARQLGDRKLPKPAKDGHDHEIDHLIRECAYEHWHRMLFARFLAENHLLIEPDSGVAITLDECEELAKDEGTDQWTLASRFAQQMLPQIFRPDDPLLQIHFAREHRGKMERLLDGLDREVFTASDSLGWVYQFWQTKRKKAVNESGNKIGADELPAVTQLFTEPYMVRFLIHNTLGAWWAGQQLASRDFDGAESEEALRRKVALENVDWEYLRFVREEEDAGPWRPAAGTFDGWPREAKDLKILDPCCGSGHFLVELLHHLVPIRMAEEGLDLSSAIDGVLRDNLHGLEIDERCTQIAAFALAFEAWKMLGKPAALPALNIACSGIAPQATKDEWLKLADKSSKAWESVPKHAHEFVRNGLVDLHEQFSQAPTLGSLIDPTERQSDLITADYETLRPFLDAVLAAETDDDETHERAIAARGMAKAADILGGDYTLVITNVPYLGRGKQSDSLKKHLETYYKNAKADLATAFVQRALKACAEGGTTALVTPQNWLFLTTYKKLREHLLKQQEWNLVARLGPGAFETISGHVVNVALPIITASKAAADHQMAGTDVSDATKPPEKAQLLRGEGVIVSGNGALAANGEVRAPSGGSPEAVGEVPETSGDDTEGKKDAPHGHATPRHGESPAETPQGAITLVPQQEQLKNPDARIVLNPQSSKDLLLRFSTYNKGICTGDDPAYRCSFWEVHPLTDDWRLLQSSVHMTELYGGRHDILHWEDGEGRFVDYVRARLGGSIGAWVRGAGAWNKQGVLVRCMGHNPVTVYAGTFFDSNTVAITVEDAYLASVWCFMSSPAYTAAVRAINQKMNVGDDTFVKVPFDLDHWQKVAAEKYPNGLPEPESDDPTQWLFHGRPDEASAGSELQVAVARLLGYRWPAELDPDMRLSDRARSLVERCAELDEYVDDDGIICIPSVRGEEPAAEQLRALLAGAYGPHPNPLPGGEGAERWSAGKERELIKATDSKAKNLDDWLRNDFFEQHCKLFHHRPFIWHIWDGRKRDGFHALVNYHALAEGDGKGRKLLEKLIYGYLGDWINRQEDGVKRGEGGAEERLSAALELKKRLEAILQGEPPFDIFVRWKPLEEQPIGWEPDINDGVRMNIRPFMAGDIPGARRGAGVLRYKPNIKWTKDRGKEPERPREQYPWFWSWDEKTEDFEGGSTFDGNRWNDLHYSNATKRAAREQAAEKEEVTT